MALPVILLPHVHAKCTVYPVTTGFYALKRHLFIQNE